MAENRRAVLSADVVALAVELGRVVQREEHLQQVAVRNHVWVEAHLHHLGVAGVAVADVLVGRVLRVAPHVAGDGGFDAAQAVEHRFEAPEAAAGEGGDFTWHGIAPLVDAPESPYPSRALSLSRWPSPPTHPRCFAATLPQPACGSR